MTRPCGHDCGLAVIEGCAMCLDEKAKNGFNEIDRLCQLVIEKEVRIRDLEAIVAVNSDLLEEGADYYDQQAAWVWRFPRTADTWEYFCNRLRKEREDRIAELEKVLDEKAKAVAELLSLADGIEGKLTDAIRMYFKRGMPGSHDTKEEWWPVFYDMVHLLCDRVDAVE